MYCRNLVEIIAFAYNNMLSLNFQSLVLILLSSKRRIPDNGGC